VTISIRRVGKFERDEDIVTGAEPAWSILHNLVDQRPTDQRRQEPELLQQRFHQVLGAFVIPADKHIVISGDASRIDH
jgi:hypothetical protein